MPVDIAVEHLLDQMHAALLAADFPALSRLSPQLEAALAELSPGRDPALLTRLRQKATRNATCAQAAGRGVRAAIRRLDEVRKNAAGLVTYDESGRRAERSQTTELSRRF